MEMFQLLCRLRWKSILSITAGLLMSASMGAQVKLKGFTRAHAGKTLVVSMEEDYISRLPHLLATTVVNGEGYFQVEFDLTEVREVTLSIGSVKAQLFVTPDKSYDVVIPEPKSDTQRRFDRADVGLIFANPDMEDINFFIPKFDADYNTFVNEHYLDFAQQEFAGSEAYKISRDEDLGRSGLRPHQEGADTSAAATENVAGAALVQEFKATMFERYAAWQRNDFAYQYMRYRIAELELAASGFRAELYKEYFFSQPMLLNHPAYMRFFTSFFENEFTDALEGRKRDCVIQAINGWRDFAAAGRCLSDNPLLTVEHVRNMAVLLGLKKAWHEELLLRGAVSEALGSAAGSVKPEYIATLAANLRESFVRHRLGYAPEPFALPSARHDTLNSESLRGQYVYLYFYTSWSITCRKELMVLSKVHEKYKSAVTLVCINMDDEYASFANDLSNYRDCEWPFVYGAADPLLREKYNIRSVPHACLLDTEGRLMYDYTRRPSEGAEGLFEELAARLRKQNPQQGQRTWKD